MQLLNFHCLYFLHSSEISNIFPQYNYVISHKLQKHHTTPPHFLQSSLIPIHPSLFLSISI